jgi:flavin reductase (DIM6/NTAB) family NADH-FMN oxidoreductase RutF
MAVSQTLFRHVLGHLASGVSVVTSLDADGEPCGLTATAVCSVSLDPPLVLVSVDRTADTHAGLRASGVYAVNLLSAEQEALAIRFSGEEPEKFRGVACRTGATGAPLLEEVPGWLDCTVVREVTAGDHTVFIGRVEDARMQGEGDGRPLVYHLGRYGTMDGAPEDP